MNNWNFSIGNPIVNRYVKSLYEVSAAAGTEKEAAAQLLNIRNQILQNDRYKKILKRISLVSKDGIEFINELKSVLNLSGEIVNLLKLLLKNKRFSLILEICDGYISFVDKIHGTKIFYVTYAKEFSKLDEKKLVENLKAVFDGRIKCIIKQDSSLVDGIKIQHRSKILDCSVKPRLARLHSAIRGDSYEN